MWRAWLMHPARNAVKHHPCTYLTALCLQLWHYDAGAVIRCNFSRWRHVGEYGRWLDASLCTLPHKEQTGTAIGWTNNHWRINQSVATLLLLCKTNKTAPNRFFFFFTFSSVAVPLIFYSLLPFLLPLKTLAQSSAKTNRFLFMLLAGQKKVLDSFKMEQEAQFKNSIILPITFNQLSSILNKKTLLMGPKELWRPHTYTLIVSIFLRESYQVF